MLKKIHYLKPAGIFKVNNLPKTYSNIFKTSENKGSIFRKYYGGPVRKEFEKKISVEELKNIDYGSNYHYKPKNIGDGISFCIVKTLRSLADVYFKKDYIRRAVVIETVAAIPGMVGGLFRHLYSLRTFKDNGDKIQKLLLEAENERQHLLTFLKVMGPTSLDKVLIKFGQLMFFNFYMLFYLFFPKTAHRFVGYLEEEAIRSYTSFIDEIKKGNIENVDAPDIAIKYWNLPENAKLIDVVRAVRADEAAHRDANHGMANNPRFSLSD